MTKGRLTDILTTLLNTEERVGGEAVPQFIIKRQTELKVPSLQSASPPLLIGYTCLGYLREGWEDYCQAKMVAVMLPRIMDTIQQLFPLNYFHRINDI